MLEIFHKNEELSRISSININTSEKKRLNTLLFSLSSLFLAKKNSFDLGALDDFSDHIEKPNVDKFISGYIYLLINGFPHDIALDMMPYASFEAILIDAIKRLYNCDDHKETKKLAKIIHILLLNPSLNINNKFCFGQEPPKLATTHIFSIWINCSDINKKKTLSELLIHLIAITPDLTSITPKPKMYSAYVLLILSVYYSTNKSLATNNLLSRILLSFDIMHIVPYITTAVYLGYLMALNKVYNEESNEINGKLCIDRSYLVGAFATKLPFVLKAPLVITRLKDNIVTKSIEDFSYSESYVKRKLLMRKYAAFKDYKSSTRFDIKFQLNPIDLHRYYSSLTEPNNAVFSSDAKNAFLELAKQTFNEQNFRCIIEELKENDKIECFLKIYEIVEKGFLEVDLETFYIMNEVFNQTCFKGYKSVLLKTNIETSKNAKVFQEFQDSLKIPNLTNTWNRVRSEFDAQYVNPQKTKAVTDDFEKEEIPTKPNIDNIPAQLFQMFQDTLVNSWNTKKALITPLKLMIYTGAFTTGAFIAISPKFIQTSLLATTLYSASTYCNPQIINIKEIGQNLYSNYSNGYGITNQVYAYFDPLVKSWKSSISSYIMAKNPPDRNAENNKR